MDDIAKKYFAMAALELEYEGDRPTYASYWYIRGMIDAAYSLGRITRLEKNKLHFSNDEIFENVRRSRKD